MMMKWILILSFLILGSLADLGQSAVVAANEEPSIRDGLTEDENEKNIINVLTRKLGDGESRGEEFCRSVLDSGSEIINLQNVRLSDIVILKKCFNQIKNKCRKSRRRPRKKSKRHPRREPKCGYRILGSGSSNIEEDTFFTPVIYKQRRGIRPRGKPTTIWLSDAPETPYTKVTGAEDFSIASMTRIKVAVHKNRRKRQLGEEKSSPLGNFLSMAFTKIGKSGKTAKEEDKNRKPATKWISLFIINAQLDTKDAKVAQNQAGILLEYMRNQEINKEGNSIILSINTNKAFEQDINKMIQDEGLLNVKETSRVSPTKSVEGFDTTMWIRDLESIVYAYTRKNNADSLLSSILFQ